MSIAQAMLPLEQKSIERQHSKLGKASLIIGICNFLIMVVLVAGMIIGGELHDANRNETFFFKLSDWCFIIFVYYIFSIGLLGFIVGLILGIVGVFRTRQKKSMSVVGLILNALCLIVTLGLDLLAVLVMIGLSALSPR